MSSDFIIKLHVHGVDFLWGRTSSLVINTFPFTTPQDACFHAVYYLHGIRQFLVRIQRQSSSPSEQRDGHFESASRWI